MPVRLEKALPLRRKMLPEESPWGPTQEVMMKEWQSLAHVRCEYKYHVVFVPKYRRKVMFGRTRKKVGKILRQLCRQKDVEKECTGKHFWSRGYCVSTVGLGKQTVRA